MLAGWRLKDKKPYLFPVKNMKYKNGIVYWRACNKILNFSDLHPYQAMASSTHQYLNVCGT